MQGTKTLDEALRLSVLAKGLQRGGARNHSELLADTLSAVVKSRETLRRSAEAMRTWGALGPSAREEKLLHVTR